MNAGGTAKEVDVNPLNNVPFSDKWREIQMVVNTLPANEPKAVKELHTLLDGFNVILVQGETGSGKTTQVPKQCLRYSGYKWKVACTQPRTLNAQALGLRVASEMDVDIGAEVGYKYRFNDKTGPSTLLTFVTDGSFVASADASFEGVDCLLIDEAHERNVSQEILFALIREHLSIAKKAAAVVKRFLIMSATMDVEAFRKYYASVPAAKIGVLHIPGRTFPVESVFLERPAADLVAAYGKALPRASDYVNVALGIIKGLLATGGKKRERVMIRRPSLAQQRPLHSKKGGRKKHTKGGKKGEGEGEREEAAQDIILFLPSKALINDCCRWLTLQDWFAATSVCYVLFSGLPDDAMGPILDRTRAPQGKRRVIVSTNIAETGVTLNGLKYCIETGMANVMRYSVDSDTFSMTAELIPKSSMAQRCGRAGRTAPGICYRIYTKEQQEKAVSHSSSALSEERLDPLILWLMRGRTEEETAILFKSLMTPVNIDKYLANMHTTGVLDGAGVTEAGEIANKLQVVPEFGQAVFLASRSKEGCGRGATVVALMATVKLKIDDMLAVRPGPAAQDQRRRAKERLSSKYGAVGTFLDIYNGAIDAIGSSLTARNDENEQTFIDFGMHDRLLSAWCRKKDLKFADIALMLRVLRASLGKDLQPAEKETYGCIHDSFVKALGHHKWQPSMEKELMKGTPKAYGELTVVDGKSHVSFVV